MSDRLQRAEQFRRTLQLFAASLAEDRALEVPTIFPAYQAGKNYAVGEYLTYGTNQLGDPQLYKVAQAHTSAAEWPPVSTPALYTPLGLDNQGYPIWAQPSGAHDAYNKGDIVSCNGTLYISLIDGNVWAPDAYPEGWEVYTHAEQS
ncbi:hypothetical protein [Flavonifractor sp. HCP28S3_F3]|uniref:hypothetical protein n=1 Tax=Flavonifractor sp. HCP28S3_F3 TaxID=3438939 RepID=UPI003F89CD6B